MKIGQLPADIPPTYIYLSVIGSFHGTKLNDALNHFSYRQVIGQNDRLTAVLATVRPPRASTVRAASCMYTSYAVSCFLGQVLLAIVIIFSKLFHTS